MKNSIEVLFSAEEIRLRIRELASSISGRFADSDEVVMVAVMRGALFFFSDLCRCVDLSVAMDSVSVAHSGELSSKSKEVRLLKDLETSVRGKHVILVDMLIDTGRTISQLAEILRLRGPHSISVCCLLDKPDRRETELTIDWVGFSIDDEFVVGFGLDYRERYGNLPYIGKLVTEK